MATANVALRVDVRRTATMTTINSAPFVLCFCLCSEVVCPFLEPRFVIAIPCYSAYTSYQFS